MTAHSPQEDKRTRILQAAEEVFAARGFFHARVSEIAKVAGVADGTIYIYFKSKDDLLISIFESRMKDFNAELRETIDDQASPDTQLQQFVSTYFKQVKDQPNVAEVLTVELRQSSKFMKEYANPHFGELLKVIAGIVKGGQATGYFDPAVPTHFAARMIFGVVDELALAWVLGRGEKFDIVHAADWVASFATKGLRTTSES